MVINDTISSTLGGANAIMDKADGSIRMVKEEVKEPADAKAVDQHVPEGQTIPNGLTVHKGLFAPKGPSSPKDQPPSNVPPS